MKILIACEESDEVRSRFEKLGFDAWSCDIQPTRNPCNKKHLQKDLTEVLKQYWDCILAFPPCTHLANSGSAWFEQKRKDGRQKQGIDFFLMIANANAKYIAIENPVGIMSNIYRKPDQIIQPYYFGDKVKKTTCLWLKGLPKLYHNGTVNLFDRVVTHVEYEYKIFFTKDNRPRKYSGNAALWFPDAETRSRERSKTFPGIANAMANQWGKFLIHNQ
jgi:site-specific DNA-cytosine methylase